MAQWYLAAKKADFDGIGRQFGISPVLARIIRNRGIIEEAAIRKYLSGGLQDLYPAEQMKDMEKAAGLLTLAVEERLPIRVIGDYDADGVCSAYILLRGLTYCGAQADAAIPHRVRDGYGLNDALIGEADRDGIGMIVTCDNGIAAADPIAYAKRIGMRVVITDHHEVPYEERANGERTYRVPCADAVVDPKQEDCPYPCKAVCGAVVAYKLVQTILKIRGEEDEAARELLEELLEFAAFATICDVVELLDENRIIAAEGLKRIQHTRNPGLRALIEVNGLTDKKLTAYHIGFILGPCLNASGRLDSAGRALDLLCARDRAQAAGLAGDLKALNDSRREMTAKGVETAIVLAEQRALKGDKVLILYLPECHESLAGIIAGRVREKYGKPTFVLTDCEEGIKGSGRSIEGYHMYEELSRCKELFLRYGGHRMAAGITLPPDRLEEFRRRMNENCGLTERDFTEKIHIDVALPLSYADKRFINELELLEPFGPGNPKPVFARKGITLLDGRIFGKNKNVGKYRIADEEGRNYEMVYFGDLPAFHGFLEQRFGKAEVSKLYSGGTCRMSIDIAYYPSLNSYGGRENIQIVMQNYQ